MVLFFTIVLIFLFLLAAFDLYVGVSNDAVNFLNSAIGSRAARFRTVATVAAAGVFAGCALSGGMMDIARHGIFHPSYFSFEDVMYIYVAVMVTDIVLLDVFNTLGMPTSTTVSLVFELLGAAFAFTMVKTMGSDGYTFGTYLNSDKAIQVILGIFMSVPIAFIMGSISQRAARLLFTFNYEKKSALISILYTGGALTVILYFMLFKGMSSLSFMTDELKSFIEVNIGLILPVAFLLFSVLSALLKFAGVNILKMIVLAGTFSLAMAFAGNDLVNFIGVPLAALSSYSDYVANAAVEPSSYMMSSLEQSVPGPFLYLFSAGLIMVTALLTSPKAQNVSKTEVGLSSRNDGEEMFGSSKAARSLVRGGRIISRSASAVTPAFVKKWIDSRYVPAEVKPGDDRAYDLVRASVNLCMTSLLIALGTSLKLPLSTTFVTFMVAMGTSLADRAWTRESAVFRVTGVLSVIGGWFITAGASFASCFLVVLTIIYAGRIMIPVLMIAAVVIVVRSQISFSRKASHRSEGDVLFRNMLSERDISLIPGQLERHIRINAAEQFELYIEVMDNIVNGLLNEDPRLLRKNRHVLDVNKRKLKNLRRRQTICLRRAPNVHGLRLSTPFWLYHNSMRQIQYGLRRMNEPVLEHVDNLFSEVEAEDARRVRGLVDRAMKQFANLVIMFRSDETPNELEVKAQLKDIRDMFRKLRYEIYDRLQDSKQEVNITTSTMLLHVIQEMEHIMMDSREVAKSIYGYHQYLIRTKYTNK